MHRRLKSMPELQAEKIDKLKFDIVLLQDSLRDKKAKVKEIVKKRSQSTHKLLADDIFRRVEFNGTTAFKEEKKKAYELWSKIQHEQEIKRLGLKGRLFSFEQKPNLSQSEIWYFDKLTLKKLRECLNVRKRNFGSEKVKFNETLYVSLKKSPKKKQNSQNRIKIIQEERKKIYVGSSHKTVQSEFAHHSFTASKKAPSLNLSHSKEYFKIFSMTQNINF